MTHFLRLPIRPLATRWRYPSAVGLLTGLWLLFFWRLLTPNPLDRVVIQDTDFTQHYYAFASYQVERLAQGQFPLWNPYNHAGDPFAGNIQFSAFYPPRLLGALLWGADGYAIEDYQLEVALHVWLASVLMLAFVGTVTGRLAAALVGSVLYAYGGYLTGYPLTQVSIVESAVWLPLILLGVHLSCTRAAWMVAGCALGGAGIALSLLGGHPQTTMYLVYVSVAYLIWLGWQKHLPAWAIVARLGLLGAVGGGLSAVQLLPALEFTRLSARIAAYGYVDKANGFQPIELLNILLPGVFSALSPLYIGVVGLLLAVMGALTSARSAAFWIGALMIGLFVSLGSGSIAYDLLYLVLPGANVFRQQERIALVISFALVMLAVEGWLWLGNVSSQDRARVMRWMGVAVAIATGTALMIALAGLMAETTVLNANTLVMTALLAALFLAWFVWQPNAPPRVAMGVLLALIVTDLFSVGTRLPFYQPDTAENRVTLPPILSDLSSPPQSLRWRVDGAAGLEGYGVYARVPDIYGTGPFTLASIEALRALPVDRFWEVLSVRYVTTTDEPPASVPMTLRAYGQNSAGHEFQLLELTNPRPLAHLVYDTRSAEGNAAFARQIMADSRVNLREMGVTLTALPFELPITRPAISRVAAFEILTPERWQMSVSTETNALLTLALIHYPGWHAKVDGQPTPLIDTYAGLIGIPIAAGMEQQVVVEFIPLSVTTGLVITLTTGGLTLLLVMGSWVRWKRRDRNVL